jgi:competence protein ComEA
MKKILMALLLLALSLFAKVDINTADASALAAIKGLGAKKAEAIVKYREQNGNFKSINDLTKVKGVGKKLLTKIEKEIEVK